MCICCLYLSIFLFYVFQKLLSLSGWVESWKFYTGVEEYTKPIPCKEGWLLVLSAARKLAVYIFENVPDMEFLLMSRFSQDFLENIFSSIRSRNGHCSTPQCA